jgi:hypothetical protein
MTRADVILMIQFNAHIIYRTADGHEHHGYVIGDSYSRFNGKNTYTISVLDPHAYSISGCYLDEIVRVVDWHIPEEHRANATEIVRQQILNSYFNGGPSGEPEITYVEGTA